jgi:dolichyl-phosphate-mannose--protein O-mannosyl transferase
MLSLAALFTAYEGRSKIWASQNRDAAEVSTRASSIRILVTHYALAGALCGLALSTKWSAAALLPILIGSLFIRPHRAASPSTLNRATVAAILALLIYTIAFYLLPFIAIQPFFGTFLGGFMKYNELAFKHHTMDAITPFRYSSPWWSWPLLLRPIWYGFERLSDGSGLIRGILCIGNPIVFLSILSALAVCLAAAVTRLLGSPQHLHRYASNASLLMLACYLINWLPWAFAERMTMFHYLYPALPFGCILSALTLSNIVSKRIRNSLLTILLLATLGMFILWYPLWSALPISEQLYRMMLWRAQWS